MSIRRQAVFAGLLLLSCGASAQSSPRVDPTVNGVQMVRDVAELIARHMPSKLELQASADKIAKTYRAQLKSVPKQVRRLVTAADQKFKDLAWQEKLNLASELWRVRSSLDLMTLLSPATLYQLTGLRARDLARLTDQVAQFELQVRNSLAL